MKNGHRWLALGALSALGFAMPAEAGYPQQAYLSCTKYTDGSGYCSGSLAGARGSSDPWAYAEFEDYVQNNATTHNRWFFAYQNSTSYACQVTSSASVALVDLWSEAITNRGYFAVYWDATGACTGVTVLAASQWYY